MARNRSEVRVSRVALSSMRLAFRTKWADRLQTVLRRARPPADDAAAGFPPAAVDRQWDEAFLRVESYLRAHHVESRVQLNRLTTEIIAAARMVLAGHPGEPPVTVAVRVAQARIGEWLVQALGEGDWTDERFRARGRLALLLANVPVERPDRFLVTSGDELPAPARADLTKSRLLPGPEVRLANMPPAPLELPLDDAIERKWSTFNRSAFVHSAMSWVVITSLVGIAWWAMR